MRKLMVKVGMLVLTAVAVPWTALALGGCGEETQPAPKVDPTSRAAAKPDRGAVAVRNRNCAKCHGDDLSGAKTPIGSDAKNTELYPPNLTNHASGIGQWTDDQLAAAIRTGYDRDGLQLCPQMKHDSVMTDYEVFSIVAYLRTLPPKENVVPRSVCPPLKLKEEQNR